MTLANPMFLLRFHAACFVSLLAATGVGAPALAQGLAGECASLSGAEEVECLRQTLVRTQEALTRAEQALQAADAPHEAAADAQAAAALGAEQAARRAGVPTAKAEAQRFSTLIVASERVYPNRLQVSLENGQTWRQIQGDTQLVELSGETPVSAEIWRSGFGGYRMRLPTIRRVLKVERIR